MTIDIIRICGALMIFLCHVCNESGSAIGSIFGQVFNVGVPIFFILSGYLHSMKASPKNIWKWYGKKCKRLLIPLYVFLLALAVVHLIVGYKINILVWLQTIVPVCGLTQKYISGCGHIWFLTHLLICYLITPLLQKYNPVHKITLILGFPLWFVIAVLLAYTFPSIWCTLFNSVFTYCIGFYILPYFINTRFHIVFPVIGVFFSCGLRLVCRILWDNTPFYNSVATEISSVILAVSSIAFIGAIVRTVTIFPSSRIISCLSERTYAFYLVHYVFLNGAIRIQLENYPLSALIALVLSIILTEIVFQLSNRIDRKFRG